MITLLVDERVFFIKPFTTGDKKKKKERNWILDALKMDNKTWLHIVFVRFHGWIAKN